MTLNVGSSTRYYPGEDTASDLDFVQAKIIIEQALRPDPEESEAQKRFLLCVQKTALQALKDSTPYQEIQPFVDQARQITVDDQLFLDDKWKIIATNPLVSVSRQWRIFQAGISIFSEMDATSLAQKVLQLRQEIFDYITEFEQQPDFILQIIEAAHKAIDRGIIKNNFSHILQNDETPLLERKVKTITSTAISQTLSLEKPFRLLLFIDICLKVHYATSNLFWITLSSPLGEGTYKKVWKVVWLAGAIPPPPEGTVWAYAKFTYLKNEKKKLKEWVSRLHEQSDFCWIEYAKSNIAECEEQIKKNEDAIRQEVAIANELGSAAVRMRIVTYNHKPQVIKGVVMECMGFSLDKYLPQFQHDPLEIAHELCFLVAHMHEHHIVHLDLKPWNFLCLPMGDRVQIKLGDFGTARKMTNPPPILSRPVSTHTSPETDHYPIEATYAMDIWSLGLTVVSVLYVSGPKTNHDFSIMSDGIPEVTDYFANQIAELTKDDKEVGTVLKGMLDPYPASRWTAQRASLAFALAKLSALDRRLKGMLPISQNAASLGATSESVCEAMW